MALARQKLREIILQILFSLNFQDDNEIISLMMNQIKTSKKNVSLAYEYAKKVFSKVDEIDSNIKQVSNSYEVERISKVELSILRLALFEMLYDEEIPPLVSISEGIRLTKKFANYHSASYVNAILDAVFQKNEAAKK
jgi:transcription antitermination protein NusB